MTISRAVLYALYCLNMIMFLLAAFMLGSRQWTVYKARRARRAAERAQALEHQLDCNWYENLIEGDVLLHIASGRRYQVYFMNGGKYVSQSYTLFPACRSIFTLQERPGPW